MLEDLDVEIYQKCWVSLTSVLGEANDLYKGFEKLLFLKLAFRIRELSKTYWIYINL